MAACVSLIVKLGRPVPLKIDAHDPYDRKFHAIALWSRIRCLCEIDLGLEPEPLLTVGPCKLNNFEHLRTREKAKSIWEGYVATISGRCLIRIDFNDTPS